MTLANKTAIVTGSTSGIGLDIARALAECGGHPRHEIETTEYQ